MSNLAQLMIGKCEKVFKSQGDSDSVIPDSDQEETLQSPYQLGTPKIPLKPSKHLRFSKKNQIFYYLKGSKREMTLSPSRNTSISKHSILKNKDSPVLIRDNK